jgi:hypothetical protein
LVLCNISSQASKKDGGCNDGDLQENKSENLAMAQQKVELRKIRDFSENLNDTFVL